MSEPSNATWKDALLPSTASVLQAIQVLDQTGLQIILVVSSDNTLLGTVTDGDIRRGLLRNCTLETPLETVMFTTPMVAPPEMKHDMVLQLMQANKIHQLPVVDASRKVVGLHLWDRMVMPVACDNMMVIMAGGFGIRLMPFTKDCPKPMLPIAGKPILEHIIERAKSQGFKHFVLAVHYLGHHIEDYFGNGERWNIRIDYLKEKTPLGTAGALGLLDPKPELPVVVTNGDVLTDINYSEILEFHKRYQPAATMAVRLHEWQHPFGVISTDGVNILSIEEKPVHRTHVNAGIYVLEASVIRLLNLDEYCTMPTLFDRLRAEGQKTIAYPMHEPWLDVGRVDDLKLAQEENA